MPNWCECDLFIQGPKARVDEFLQFVKSDESDFDFDRLIPYPERFKELDRIKAEWDKQHLPPGGNPDWNDRPKDGFNQGGYEWCIANWGTKWFARGPEVSRHNVWQEEDGPELLQVEINFATAWSPPTPIIQRAGELFPDLHFELRYFESGAAFNGIFVCEDGEVVADRSGNYYGDRGG